MTNIEGHRYRAETEFVKRITGCREVNGIKMFTCEFRNSNDVELTPSKIVVKYAPRAYLDYWTERVKSTSDNHD